MIDFNHHNHFGCVLCKVEKHTAVKASNVCARWSTFVNKFWITRAQTNAMATRVWSWSGPKRMPFRPNEIDFRFNISLAFGIAFSFACLNYANCGERGSLDARIAFGMAFRSATGEILLQPKQDQTLFLGEIYFKTVRVKWINFNHIFCHVFSHWNHRLPFEIGPWFQIQALCAAQA